ncbi:MAG: PASTA domain-containing protein [Candidatus Cloacimonadota bacterium]|nr:MAG: PASTA domain-containing protein [Candidatus Cloacimonadota bacterium]
MYKMKIKKILFWLFVAFVSFLVGVLLMNFIIMPLIVRQGNIVTVPDVTEMELTEAEKILKSMELEPYIELFDYDPAVPENYVYRQEPSPGTELKASRSVKLWISKGQKEILVPYLVGLPLIQAENILQRFELKIAKIEHVETDSLPPGKVIKTIPPSNTPVRKNTEIIIVVSKGSADLEGFPMPNLFGRNLAEIEKPIRELGLIIGNIQYIENETGESGEIILQSPQPEVLVSPGDTITLIVTTVIVDTVSVPDEENP